MLFPCVQFGLVRVKILNMYCFFNTTVIQPTDWSVIMNTFLIALMTTHSKNNSILLEVPSSQVCRKGDTILLTLTKISKNTTGDLLAPNNMNHSFSISVIRVI